MASQFNEVFSDLFGGIFSISAGLLVGLILVVFALAFIWYFFFYRRKFDIKVKIISDRASDPRIFFDKGAILKEKDGNKYFRLWSTKVELSVPNFKVLESTNQGDYLEVYRSSEDNFSFLTKPIIDKEIIVKSDGKAYRVSSSKQRQIEGDYYYIAKRRAENKKLIDPEGLLMKLLQWAPQIISAVITFMLVWVLLDKAPEIISVVRDLASELKEVAIEMRSLKGGTITAA